MQCSPLLPVKIRQSPVFVGQLLSPLPHPYRHRGGIGASSSLRFYAAIHDGFSPAVSVPHPGDVVADIFIPIRIKTDPNRQKTASRGFVNL